SAFWSTSATGVNATSNNATTALDQLRFSAGTDATGSYTVTVSGAQTARQLSLEYGNITFSGGTINLSSNRSGTASNVGTGIVLASTAGNATISSNLTIDGVQMLNIAADKSLTLNTGTFTRNAGSSLNIISGTVNSSMTGLSSLTNGILGPWATIGQGNSTRYATIASGTTISGLTGTAAETAANVTDGNGTLNYDVAGASAAFGAGASVNTLRFTGGGGTMSGNLTTNGLLHAGSGGTTLSGDITIGSTRELVVTPASNSFTISGVLKDNAGGPSSLLVTQAGNSTVLGLTLSNNNTYSGGTTISNARLAISANNALGTGAVSVLKGGVAVVGDYGGVLEVSNNITWSNDMSLAGQGYYGYSGALRNISGNNTHTGTITAADIVTRITATSGTLSLNGNINLTTAGAYNNLLQHAGGDIRLGGGGITGSATTIGVLGTAGGTNFLILDRAFAWGNSTALLLGSGVNYGRVDLNGNNQSVTSLTASGNVTTENLITNRSSTLASFTINNTSNFNATPTFSGNLVIVKNGGGQATMSTIGTHTGGWIINNGTLSTGSAQTFGTGNVTINSGGTIGLSAGTSSYSNNFSIAGPGSANGALQASASGNYTFSGAVALTGDATLGARATTGSGTGLIFTGGISTGGANRTLTLNTFGGTFGNSTVNTNHISLNSTTNLGTGGNLTMGNGMVAGGTGTYNINVGGNTWGTTIVQGLSTAAASSNTTLNLGAANALGSSSSVLQLGNFNTAREQITVNLNGNSQTIGGLRSFGSTGSASANGTRTVTSDTAATLTIDNSSGTNYLYNGVISGAISLTKNGNATQTLSGTNTYSGTTTINQGVLNITSNSTLPGLSTNGRYSVANGATLAVSNAVTDADIASMLGT
ncbi:MAG: beta strand repeat-containing protein, partial [Verrucomicrobiota bacterium]